MGILPDGGGKRKHIWGRCRRIGGTGLGKKAKAKGLPAIIRDCKPFPIVTILPILNYSVIHLTADYDMLKERLSM
jgi:hypothetical protein